MNVVAYIDGLNLYHGLRSKYGRAYLWLDVAKLAGHIRRDDNILKIRYFTAVVKGEPEAAQRQETYLAALTVVHPEIEIVRGYFKKKTARCKDCRTRWTCTCTPAQVFETYEEKLTDVALGVAMVTDAASGYGDMSLLVSADTDFQPAVKMSLRLAPSRQVIVACPPGRVGVRHSLDGQVTAFSIPEAHVAASLLPATVYGPDGRVYERPKKWR